ncbi:MAG: flagellar basal-body rod protein FlgF [Alphaproteobacteria bacterium]|nr:flagellar basal-body rod protein FlgF [Alphaproteobacteria bacterium]
MDNSLLVSLSHQLAAYRSMDVIANNIANASTPGFKRETAKFEEYATYVRPSETQTGPQALSFVKDAGIVRDLGQGELNSTGATLDFAINGKGFFAVQTPAGMRYTRDGHFSLNQDGQLVTSNGYAVQGDGGAITITPDDGTVSVGADGTISSILNGAANQIAKLQVVTFPNERAMTKVGSNLYSTTQAATPTTESTVAQRMLEGSNVKPVIEISHMVEVMRAYEMTATMTNSQEQLMRQAIDKLGSMPN